MGMGIIENLVIGMTGHIMKPRVSVKARPGSSSPVKRRRGTSGVESQFELQAKGLAAQEELYSPVKGANFRVTTRK